MPGMWFSERRNDAGRRLQLFLRMHQVPHCFETKSRRLLRVLFFWYRSLSANSTRKKLLLTHSLLLTF